MSKYTRNQRQEPQDEFIGFWEKLYEQARPLLVPIAIGLGVLVLIVVLVGVGAGWSERKAQSATEALGQAVRLYEADLNTGGETPKADEENPVPRFATAPARAEAALKALDDFDAHHGSSEVAGAAKVLRAGIYYDLGRCDDAAPLYQKFLAGAHPSPLTATAREGLGLCREQQGKLDDALQIYRELEPKSGDYYRDRALWNQARVWKKKGDKGKAIDRLKELLAKVPSSALKDDAQTQISELEGT